MVNNINLTPKMCIGGGAITCLPQVLSELDCNRPCIISDKIILNLTEVAETCNRLKQHVNDIGKFDQVMPEPDDKSILAAVELVKSQKFDALIAIGGGSAIDSAKAIALLASHGGKIRDYKVPYVIQEQSIPVIALPTTAGTGSECTAVTVISDSETSEKMLCMGSGLMPKAAILDYTLTLSAPFRVSADTGIDALTHAIEAYVSKKANLFSDQQAIAAMRLIGPNLISACKDKENYQAKEAMMLGASLAGIAFSNASVALVHGMSRPIGVHFHVPHGMSNAMLLPAITEYSIPATMKRYAQCAGFVGIINDTVDDEIACGKLISFLKEINQTLEVPSMSEFGIDKRNYESMLDTMAEQALASGSPGNNPIVPDKKSIIELYQRVYA